MRMIWKPVGFLALLLTSLITPFLSASWLFVILSRPSNVISASYTGFPDKVWIHGLGVDIKTKPFTLSQIEGITGGWPESADEVAVFEKGVKGPILRFHPSELENLAAKSHQVREGDQVLISRNIDLLEYLVLMGAVVLAVLAWLTFVFSGFRSCSSRTTKLSWRKVSLISFFCYLGGLIIIPIIVWMWISS